MLPKDLPSSRVANRATILHPVAGRNRNTISNRCEMADQAAEQLANAKIADESTKEQLVDENGQPLSKR